MIFSRRNVRQRKGVEQGWNSVAYQPEEVAWMASPPMRGEKTSKGVEEAMASQT